MKTKTSSQRARFAHSKQNTTATMQKTMGSELPADRPWTPAQIFLVTFLFGILAGIVCFALNYGRLKEPKKGLFWAASSLVITPLTMVLCLQANIPMIGFAMSLLFGLFLMLLQQPTFESWKEAKWNSITNEPYKPNELLKLFAVSIACCIFQLLGGLALAASMSIR